MRYVIDIETEGLLITDNINFVGIYNGDEDEYFLYTLPQQQMECIQKLESIKEDSLIYHNGQFDAIRILRHLKVDLPITHDTLVLAYLTSTVPELSKRKGNKPKSLSLKSCAKRELGIDDWDIHTKDKVSKDPELVLPYLKLDLKNTWLLYKHYSSILPKEAIKTYKLIMRATNAYKVIGATGMTINLEQLEDTLETLKEEHEMITNDLRYYTDINFNSPKQLQKLLFEDLGLPPYKKTKSGDNSTDTETLVELSDKHPIIPIILKQRKVGKCITFLEDWKSRAVDSRLYANFKLTSTVTGRTSCSDPNLQQIPRDKRLKNLFQSIDPEWEFVQMDFSQAELRFAALVSGCKAIKRAYVNGEDLHTNMAAVVAHKDRGDVTPAERTGAKAAKKLAANLTT